MVWVGTRILDDEFALPEMHSDRACGACVNCIHCQSGESLSRRSGNRDSHHVSDAQLMSRNFPRGGLAEQPVELVVGHGSSVDLSAPRIEADFVVRSALASRELSAAALRGGLKVDAYEGLIEKTAQEGARGAGQYFTPRALINAVVDVMAPGPDDRICDPACGTGGFFLGAYRSIIGRFPRLEPDQVAHLRSGAFTGWEIADLPARLCAMNMLLHGIESPESDSPIVVDDALRDTPGKPFDMVLTNPPFGRSSSDSYERDDFWATTRNKQLNFVQHVVSLLRIGGNAAVVVPDKLLFEAGAGETIRRRLLHDCEVHTLLRLPTGIFYAQGVKANVLFFRRREGAAEPWTRDLWVYDLRTNQHYTLKQNPLTRADLGDFVACYRPEERHKRKESERFKRYTYDELIARDKVSLDLFWLRDESLEDTDNLPPPAVLAAEIAEDLESALAEIQALAESLAAASESG